MIETMEIIIKNGPVNLIHALIFFSENICYKNKKKFNVSNEFLDNLTRTIRLWKNEYGSNNRVIDSEEFKVIVQTKDKKEIFHGKGLFPDNYISFKELLGDIHD